MIKLAHEGDLSNRNGGIDLYFGCLLFLLHEEINLVLLHDVLDVDKLQTRVFREIRYDIVLCVVANELLEEDVRAFRIDFDEVRQSFSHDFFQHRVLLLVLYLTLLQIMCHRFEDKSSHRRIGRGNVRIDSALILLSQ